ncbi:MAG TPA: TOMM precursor leader peptide-binding protein [Solirubrobacteraceae bacterium]
MSAGPRGPCDERGVAVRRLRLRPGTEVFPAEDGDVYLLDAAGRTTIAVRAPDQRDRALLERLATGPVEAPPGSAVAARLEPLVEAGAVTHVSCSVPLGAVEGERFSRQLGYLSELGDANDVQRRLRSARIAVLGCGGLGTWAVGALACAGIGGFVLIDDDAVDLSNLNRQILYRLADVGASKVERTAAWLAAFDPTIEVGTRREHIAGPEPLAQALAGCDALVLVADWPPYELMRWANGVCVALRMPLLTAGQQPPLLKIGPTYVPGRSACHACHETQVRRVFPLYDQLAEHRRRHVPEAITLGPASAVIGALLALEVMHLVASEEPVATQGRARLLDMRSLEASWEDVQRDPECPVCGSLFDT